MPYGDGTGPLGLGPGTGWGRGPCSGYSGGYRRPGRFFGRGTGYRNRYWAGGVTGWPRSPWHGWYPPVETVGPPFTEEEEATFLRREAEDLERALGEVRERLQKMEKSGK